MQILQIINIYKCVVPIYHFQLESGYHPYKHVECDNVTQPYMDVFDADTNLINFLGSTLGLKTSLGQDNDNQGRPNICNENRVVNIATLYLAHSLGLLTQTLIESYTFVVFATQIFPMPKKGGPKATYIPENVPAFPSLEQAFWTILNQYTPATEINIRRDKSNLWCWYVGKAVMDHCLNIKSSQSCDENVCKDVWKYFVETCHRVRSINPIGDYQVGENVNRWCMWNPHPDYRAYYLAKRPVLLIKYI